jgi:diguanylate cyclase (GGDEF)-like protein
LENGEFVVSDEEALNGSESGAEGRAPEPVGDWRGTREAVLRKVAPVASTGKRPVELRELKRYLLGMLGLISIGLLLAIVDEAYGVPHLTAGTTTLMVAVVVTSLVAIFRARAVAEGLIRTAPPPSRDPVTGLPDESYFRLRLREECKRVHRYGIPVSLAIIDINNLASVNEAYGEACGDAVLKHVATILESTKRASDIAVHLGDDEFALILLECEKGDALQYVRRLEHYVTRKAVTVSVEDQMITLWIGVCTGLASAREEESPEQLLAEARQDLQTAKEERDRRRERWSSSPA